MASRRPLSSRRSRRDGGARRRCRGGCSVTHHVRALARVAVAARLVPAAIDHAMDGLDAEVAVAQRAVPAELRPAALDLDAVVPRVAYTVAPEPGALCGGHDVHPILARPADVVATDHAANHLAKADDDRVVLGVPDRVACDHVV